MKEGINSYNLALKLFPIYRSITGDGVRETLKIIKDYIGIKDGFQLYEVKSGSKAFDWTVPKEWKIRDAYIESENGERFADFKDNNLHVMGYSIPVDKWIDYDELMEHIYTQPDQQEAIPYVTSYYNERYGFCISEIEKSKIKPGTYHVYIDSDLFDGSLTYGELIIKGKVDDEVLFSTYSCHPSMANDNCSGLVLSAELAKYIKDIPERHYTYRFVFLPETIGAIVYLSQNNRLEYLKKKVIAGYSFSCVGDNGNYSIIQTKNANSLSDRALLNVLEYSGKEYKIYSYLDRGSDERQYNSPGADMSVVGFCRTKYWEFPEYHTSLDNMDFISAEGLQGSFNIMREVVDNIEHNYIYKMAFPCEPQLGKRGLYPEVSQKGTYDEIQAMMNFIGYADGKQDLIDISNMIHQPVGVLIPIIDKLLHEKIITIEKEIFK